jgi:uncharacterized repeat protein (TIGR01451 family)
MNADLNSRIQRKLNKNKKSKNMKRLLLVLSLVAVIVTSTVLANPASALTEDDSGEVVQGLENGGDSGNGAQAPAQAADEQADAQGNEAAPSSDPQETLAAPSADQGVMNANSVSAVDSAAVAENGTGDSGIAVSGAEADGTEKSADKISAAEGSETAEQGATLAEAAETVSTEEAAAEKTTEQASQSETDVLSFADDRAQVKIARKDGTGFPSDTTMSGSPLGTDDWNRVLSAVSSKVKAQSDDSTAYSVAGLHTWTLSLQAGDGSAASYDDIRAEAEFQGGLNDAGYATKTSEKEENGTDGTSITTASYETFWRVYAISGDSIADPVEDHLTDLTDADGTSLSVDENGALQSAAFDVSLPETVVFAQIVRETVTTGTEKKKEIPMPAVTFDREVATDHGTIMVHVEADEGTFEQGTTMSVKQVSSEDILDKAIEAAGGRGSAAAVDISFRKADGTETEPAKPIRVKMTAKVLGQADKAHVVHVDDTGSTDVVAKKSDGKTIESTSSEAASSDAKNVVSFKSDSFSVYAIVYTVDFSFSGYTYSIKGGSSIRLSSLAKKLGLHDTKQNKDFAIDDVDDVTFSNSSLVEVTKKDGDWELVSKKPFTSTEKLTISMKDGSKYEVEVKDEQGDQVNQGTTCKAYFVDENVSSGEQLNAKIELSNSSANGSEDAFVKVTINGLSSVVGLQTKISPTKWNYYEIDGSNLKIKYYYDEKSNSVIFGVPAGATAIVPLNFIADNGLTPNNTSITLTPSKCDEDGNEVSPSQNDKIGNPVKGTWTSKFAWDPITKTVNDKETNEIAINDSDESNPKLTGSLTYKYTANTRNKQDSGAIWTKAAVVEDTLTLPEGVTFPKDYSVNTDDGEITDNKGKTIWKLNLQKNMKVSGIEVSSDRREITYSLDISNPYIGKEGTLPREMDNLSWYGTLNADELVLDANYPDRVTKKDGGQITNQVHIEEKSVVDNLVLESTDTVRTVPTYKGYHINKSVKDDLGNDLNNQDLNPGDEVIYTIRVTNQSSEDISGGVITDNLPKAMTLTSSEIDRLRNSGVKVEYHDWDHSYTITYGKDVPAKGEVILDIHAKVKDPKEIKRDNYGNDDASNTATYKDESSTVINKVHYGTLSVEKTGNNKDQSSDQVKTSNDGDIIIFTVKVSNKTQYPADKEYLLTDTLPAYLQLILYRDEDCTDQILTDDLYTGKGITENSVYVKGTDGIGHLVNVDINEDGRTTITKAYQYEDGFPANSSESFGYEVKYNAQKVSESGNDGSIFNADGTVTYRNVASIDDGTSGSSEFKGKTGKVDLTKEVTKAESEEGTTADQPYPDNTIVTYQIHVNNDESNPRKSDIVVKDELPAGLVPYGLKKEGKVINDYDTLYNLAKQNAVMEDEAGQSVMLSFENNQFQLTWTLQNKDGKFISADINYRAKILASKISNAVGQTITLTNKATSGGTTAEKSINVKGNGLTINKLVYDETSGEWVKDIKITPGGTYTYKLQITNPSNQTVVATNLVDKLPSASIGLSGSYWNQDTVNVDPNGDFINNRRDINQKVQIYNSEIHFPDVEIGGNQTLTQEVTLKWPDDVTALSQWYSKKDEEPGSSQNIFSMDTIKAPVDHHLDLEKAYYLQKSVIALNYGQDKTTSGKVFFDKNNLQYVEYGVLFANTGKTNLHLSQLTDVIPDGLEYYGIAALDQNKGGIFDNDWNVKTDSGELKYNSYYDTTNYNYSLPEGYSFVTHSNTWSPLIVTPSIQGQSVNFTPKFEGGTDGVDLKPGQVIAFNIWCKVKTNTVSAMADETPIRNVIQAQVDSDAKLKPIMISTKNTPYDENQNNGSCTEFTGKDTEHKTAESSVTIYPMSMAVPGIQKTAVKYQEWNESKNDWGDWRPGDGKNIHLENLPSQSQIQWTIRLYNDGTEPIHGYSVRDILRSAQKYSSATWKLDTDNSSKEIKFEEDAANNAEEGVKYYKYSWQAPQDIKDYDIPGGHYAEITLITNFASDNMYQGQVTNDAYFEPDPKQKCNYNAVQKGQLEADGNGEYIGVSSGDYVNMYGSGATISYKQVTEMDDSPNTAYGYNISTGGNYITVSDKEDTIRYTTSVTNVSDSSIFSYTMIDMLPEPGDTGVVNADEKRSSEYTVNLLHDPNFDLLLTGKDSDGNSQSIRLFPGTDYEVEYSTLTAPFTERDWRGENSENWNYAYPEKANSFRIKLNQDAVYGELKKKNINNIDIGTVIPKQWTLQVSFNCSVGKDAKPGDIAWNSFGYRYAYTKDLKNFATTEPPKVGVKLPPQPVIKKIVVDNNGKELGEDENVKFKFKFYEGSYTPDTLPQNIEPVFTSEISQGGYDNLKPKVTVNGEEQGIFKEGTTYTVIEEPASGYETARFEVKNGKEVVQFNHQNYCTFIYKRDKDFNIKCVNQETRSFSLPSTGGHGTLPLAGAGALLLLLAGTALTVRKLLIQRNTGKGGGSE